MQIDIPLMLYFLGFEGVLIFVAWKMERCLSKIESAIKDIIDMTK